MHPIPSPPDSRTRAAQGHQANGRCPPPPDTDGPECRSRELTSSATRPRTGLECCHPKPDEPAGWLQTHDPTPDVATKRRTVVDGTTARLATSSSSFRSLAPDRLASYRLDATHASFGFPQKTQGFQRLSASATVTSRPRAWPRRLERSSTLTRRPGTGSHRSERHGGWDVSRQSRTTEMPHRTTTKRTQTMVTKWRTPKDPPHSDRCGSTIGLLSAIVDVRCHGRVATTTASRHVHRSTPESNTTVPSPEEPCELTELRSLWHRATATEVTTNQRFTNHRPTAARPPNTAQDNTEMLSPLFWPRDDLPNRPVQTTSSPPSCPSSSDFSLPPARPVQRTERIDKEVSSWVERPISSGDVTRSMPLQRRPSMLPPTDPTDRPTSDEQPQPRYIDAGRLPLVSTSRHEAEANIAQVRHRPATWRLTSRTTQNPGEPENPSTTPNCSDRRPPTRPIRLGAFGPSPNRPRKRPSGSGPQEDPHQTASSPNVLNKDVANSGTHQKRQVPPSWRRNAKTTESTTRLRYPKGPSPPRTARSECCRRRRQPRHLL
jgi:hypothetical protein